MAALLAATLMSCATTPTRPVVVLPNDYYLQPDDAMQSEIVKRGGQIVVPAPIAAYAVSGDLVAGASGAAPAAGHLFPDRAFTGNASTRYFILDTGSGRLESDLDHADWKKRLKELQVPSDFEILPPLPWQP
ncbi:MAG TPA: hypothetical protein VMU67_03175 [Steroidobacteraceae bacterium]|nr:hypothetical protein [Steroidobacteraceae bacterium]